jgi:hydrogenase maturation protein HypF
MAQLDQTTAEARLRLEISGAVQGVGFRPFIYRLAADCGLAGWVLNGTSGVVVEVEGERAAIERFCERVAAEAPSAARVIAAERAWLEPAGLQGFSIRHSDDAGPRTVQVLPDLATCPACLAELRDPADRRHRYPFTNCTNCGPRFTIVEALPYDRPNTTMRAFALCPACAAEYRDPLDRRFHAQPNACPACGPQIQLWTAAGAALGSGEDALTLACNALRDGRIVAVKGLGGFHLVCDARDERAVAELRRRKGRGDKPFALMVRDLAMAAELCALPPEAADLMAAPEAPIVLLVRHDPAAGGAGEIAPSVAPGCPTLGLMLPATPLHHLLMDELRTPIVATSGNLSDEPICTAESEAVARLGAIADLLLIHDRPIARHADDSVAFLLHGEPRLLRRARGYAPAPVLLRREAPCILGVGAQLKSAVALSVGRQVVIGQHIGDLDAPEARAAFERAAADLARLYEATPAAVAHDLHPSYYSTEFALRHASAAGPRPVAIQHHHAHLASVLAEHQHEGQALGVIWDGTGYGPDGTIWGGEFLLGDVADSRRVGHLRPFPLPGGDAAVREPRRSALALLHELDGPAALEHDDLPPLRAFAPAERAVLARMIARGLNCVPTSSAGRLFDGVAALLGLCQRSSYEGEAAMLLEYAADPHERGAYPLELAGAELDWRPALRELLADRRRGVATGVISARFHNGMVAALAEVVRHVAPPAVALSGGCFQNRLLVERAAAAVEGLGLPALLHRLVPPNDGGISLGQVAAAAARLRA